MFRIGTSDLRKRMENCRRSHRIDAGALRSRSLRQIDSAYRGHSDVTSNTSATVAEPGFRAFSAGEHEAEAGYGHAAHPPRTSAALTARSDAFRRVRSWARSVVSVCRT